MRYATIATLERYTHQVYWGKEFGEGLKRHGWHVDVLNRDAIFRWPLRCDLLVMWGIRRQDMIARQKQRHGQVCILERGYILDRMNWTSVSFGGGLNGRGIYRGPLDDPTRWEKHFSHLIKPWWDRNDGYALIMGQVPGDTAVANVSLPNFYKQARIAFKELGIECRFREHPRFHTKPIPLEPDLSGARCVVTWNSNSGVDAALGGVPTISMDIGSMAWDVSGHKFAPPPTPDRTAWAHAIAWKQWTVDEMRSGYCWEIVGGEAKEPQCEPASAIA